MLCSTAVCVHMLVRCARFDTRGSLSYVCVVPMGRDVITYVCMMAPQTFPGAQCTCFVPTGTMWVCVILAAACVSSSCACVCLHHVFAWERTVLSFQ